MTKNSKFQHKWIFDRELAKSKATGIWSLTYIDGKGMFCSLCRLTNTAPSNASKIWNSQPDKRYKPETIRGHFLVETGKRTMHTDAVAAEKAKCGSYFIENEKYEEASFSESNEKGFTALFWLCKQEIAHSKFNSMLELLESH